MRTPANKLIPDEKPAYSCPTALREVGVKEDFIEYLQSLARKDMQESVRKDLTPERRDHLAGRYEVVMEILTAIEKAMTFKAKENN